ncbi:MAG: glycosyltransferase family 1 protein [Proteobacteria bacterium]|nr:glycosyltransferase family 1 protein [Pseudomonadota bacterium]
MLRGSEYQQELSSSKDDENEFRSFDKITNKIKLLISEGRSADIASTVRSSIGIDTNDAQKQLLKGIAHYFEHDFKLADDCFSNAVNSMDKRDCPELNSIYTVAYINAQRNLSSSQRRAIEQGGNILGRNLEELRVSDLHLAEEIEISSWPLEYELIYLWHDLCLFSNSKKIPIVLSESEKIQFHNCTKTRNSIAFGSFSIGGQLVAHIIETEFQGIHGIQRPHHLFEPDLSKLKALLSFRDFSEALRTKKLFIYGGVNLKEQFKKTLATLRYQIPKIIIGDTAIVETPLNAVIEEVFGKSTKNTMKEATSYYASPEFRQRQIRIAKGDIQPRILVHTCRWTTFLKYCAKDFDTSFSQLNCDTRFIIEDDDSQALLGGLFWRELDEFKPDVFFMISHGRPSMSYLPQQLPFICYVQDICGAIRDLPDWTGHFTNQDLFICVNNEALEHMLTKNIPKRQLFVMPVPTDPDLFVPLPKDHPEAINYTVDISFVKHGYPATKQVLNGFLNGLLSYPCSSEAQEELRDISLWLFQRVCCTINGSIYKQYLLDLAHSQFQTHRSEETHKFLDVCLVDFYHQVYSAAWRTRFLEALMDAGLKFTLYGNNWEQHPTLSSVAAGPVVRDEALNFVYNFSRINLSILHTATMHQRVSECSLAGGFLMVADHLPDMDCGPAREFFEEESEIIFFNSPKNLVDRCRYYLEHEDERLEIAHNMHQRAKQERTCLEGAKTILSEWRRLLSNQHHGE